MIDYYLYFNDNFFINYYLERRILYHDREHKLINFFLNTLNFILAFYRAT